MRIRFTHVALVFILVKDGDVSQISGNRKRVRMFVGDSCDWTCHVSRPLPLINRCSIFYPKGAWIGKRRMASGGFRAKASTGFDGMPPQEFRRSHGPFA